MKKLSILLHFCCVFLFHSQPFRLCLFRPICLCVRRADRPCHIRKKCPGAPLHGQHHENYDRFGRTGKQRSGRFGYREQNAAGTEGTSLYLKAGDKVTLRDLLYGLMLQSGNDAAIAIAEHVAGSVDEFAALMTARANNRREKYQL